MKKKSNSLLFNTFVGENVDIMLNSSIERVEQSEEGTTQQSSPMGMNGIMISIDESWLYLGDSDGNITDALKLDNIAAIAMHKEMDIPPQYTVDKQGMN